MLYIIDKLIIAFIYLNVLTANLTVSEIPVAKVLVLLSLFFYAIYYFGHGIEISKRMLGFIYISTMLIAVLAAVGLLKGNQLEYVAGFVTPIFVLFMIPVFFSLYKKYGVERYIKHFLFAIVLLAVTVIGIYLVCIGNRPLGFWLNEFSDNFQIAYRGMDLSLSDLWSIRIVAKTAGFFPAGLIMAYYYYKKRKAKLCLVAIGLLGFAVYLGHTFTIICAAMISLYVVSIHYIKARNVRRIGAVLALLLVVIGVKNYLTQTIENKGYSASIKAEQAANAMDYFAKSPVFGQGMGYLYRDMDQRGTEDTNLEVTYVMLLTSMGIIGFLFYAFIYLYYPWKSLLLKNRGQLLTILVISHISVIIAGAGNPYILSGGMGLIFVVMLAALYEMENVPEFNEQLTGCPI